MSHRRSLLAPQWTPFLAAPYAIWDAKRLDNLTLTAIASGDVANWRDGVNSFSPSAASLRPSFTSTGFNGHEVVTFNGTDDVLASGNTGVLPVAAVPCEIWGIIDQTALAADATLRWIIAWGSGTGAIARGVARNVSSGANRIEVRVGNGSTIDIAFNNSVAFSGRHIFRAIITGTTIQVDLDGVAGSPVSSVPNTNTTRTRIGASANTGADLYHQGGIHYLAVTPILTAPFAQRMYNYLNPRLL